MNSITKRQIDNNKASQERWKEFANHRLKVTALLSDESMSRQSRLCILGAGNCNDVDLNALVRSHREVHLVDLDGEALAYGAARQGLADSTSVRRYGGVDLTGMLDALVTWSPATVIQSGDLAACVEEPSLRIGSTLPGPFEVVASTCLLSQLIDAAVRTVGETHPRFLELMQAIRVGHLQLLTHLIAPGGTGVLITDIVSSDTFSELASVPEAALSKVLGQLVRERNFFHGVNPAVLVSLFRSDPVLRSRVVNLKPIHPWHWNLGPRCYGVCAVKVQKKDDGSSTSNEAGPSGSADGGRRC